MEDLPFTTLLYLTWSQFWWIYLILFIATYYTSRLYFSKKNELVKVPPLYTFLYFTLYYLFLILLVVIPIFIGYIVPNEQI